MILKRGSYVSVVYNYNSDVWDVSKHSSGSNFVRNTRATGVALYSTVKQTHVLGRHKGAI